MRRSDRMIVVVVPLIALAVGFWLLVISPKQSESGELQDKIDSLNERIDAAESQIASAELARDNFSKNYGELVSLGRAVPENSSEQSTLIYDLAGLSKQNDLNFRNFEVTDSGGAAEASTPPPAASTQTQPNQGSSGDQGGSGGDAAAGSTPSATPAAATEATAATLPIGAVTGPAELPVMPYEFRFLGNFFHVADFLADIDHGVTVSKNGKVKTNGRLMTINGFSLTGDRLSGFPNVEANFSVTTYLVPAEQGVQAGATPAGPAPVGSPADPTPVANSGGTP